MNDSTYIGKRVQNLEIGDVFDVYTRVILHAKTKGEDGKEEDVTYVVGTTTGQTMEVTDPMGTEAKAQALLKRLNNSRWNYQPHRADMALLDPVAELGDGVTINGIYSAVCKTDSNFSPLMEVNMEAPADEELEHEYPYIPKTERTYKRETAELKSMIAQTANSIDLIVNQTIPDIQESIAEISVEAGGITSIVQSTYVLNMIPYPYENESGYTHRGVKFTVQSNGRIDADGTATGGDASFKLGEIELQSGRTYTVSINGGGTTVKSCGLRVRYNKKSGDSSTLTTLLTTYTNASFTIDTNKYDFKDYVLTFLVVVPNGTTVDKEKLYPQLEYGAIAHPWQKTAGSYVSRITQNESEITARVTQTGGSSKSFAWSLTADGFRLLSKNKEVFRCDSTGVSVDGEITATSGSIGGIKINKSSIESENGNFKVTSGGVVTAKSMNLYGTLNMYNADGTGKQTITASTLALYAKNANAWINTPSPSYGGQSPGNYALGGAGAGYSAQTDWKNARSSAVGAGTIYGNFVGGVMARSLQIASSEYGSFVNIGLWSGTIDGQHMQLVVWQ